MPCCEMRKGNPFEARQMWTSVHNGIVPVDMRRHGRRELELSSRQLWLHILVATVMEGQIAFRITWAFLFEMGSKCIPGREPAFLFWWMSWEAAESTHQICHLGQFPSYPSKLYLTFSHQCVWHWVACRYSMQKPFNLFFGTDGATVVLEGIFGPVSQVLIGSGKELPN